MNVSGKTLSALLVACLAISCNTFKPISKQQSDYTSQLTSKLDPKPAKFISDIAINPVKQANTLPAQTASQQNTLVNETSESLKVNNSGSAKPVIENSSMLQFRYAMMLDIPVEEITNFSLYTFIDEWYGTRYRFGGTTKRGIDCSSFTQKLYAQTYGLEIPRTAVTQYAASKRIKRDDLQEGDLIFFHTTRSGISHVGVYLGNDRFVHASSSRGIVINNLNESYYVNAYRSAGRFETEPAVIEGTK
jgi:hypothetical protein